MSDKNVLFSDMYVKSQESALSIGIKLLLAVGIVVTVLSIFLMFRSNTDAVAFLTLGVVYLLWAGVAKQRLQTFRENVELHRSIQQLLDDRHKSKA